MPPSSGELQAVINHIFLPPLLPQNHKHDIDLNLPPAIKAALHSLKDKRFPPAILENATDMVASVCSINNSLYVNELELRRLLMGLPVGKMIAMQLSEQNAGVMISRSATHLIFECFELSPSNEAVMSTKGRLVRTLPSVGVMVDAGKLHDADFAIMISSTLAKMSSQAVPDMQPQSKKSGVQHDETRDTTDPSAVSGAFFAMLSSIGVACPTTAITKHTREEVRYKSAALPWRRAPIWLLLRAALQLVIERSTSGSRELYKQIMCGIMGYFLAIPETVHLSMDMIYIMEAKISRRLWKLGDEKHAAAYVHDVVRRSHERLVARWLAIQQQDSKSTSLDMSGLSKLDFLTDSNVVCPNLDAYIKSLETRAKKTLARAFVPQSALRLTRLHTLPDLDINEQAEDVEKLAILHDFESWVANSLPIWTQSNLVTTTPGRLRNLMSEYYRYAACSYEDNPEAISVMLLTIFSIWTECDRATTHCCPLLAEYDPHITTHVFENLLLANKAQMQQLLSIERYLKQRTTMSTRAELFDVDHEESFAACFVKQSKEHNDLGEKIVNEAKKLREQKIQELQTKQAEYRRLTALLESTQHETQQVVEYPHRGEPQIVEKCVRDCARCRLAAQRGQINIVVFEWPLPTNSAASKTVIFELLVPSHIGHWRESRALLLQGVLRGSRPSSSLKASYILGRNDPHLSRYYRSTHQSSRLGLLSETKPALGTHYQNKHIQGLTVAKVCVSNGLQYRYWDQSTSTFITTINYKDDVQLQCTYRLPSPGLRDFIFRPCTRPNGLQPNEILARQHSCPPRMSLEEFKDLASIPLGHRIQWLNLATQMMLPSINFKHSEAGLVILQCINQTGPGNDTVFRAAHDSVLIDAAAVISSVRASIQRLRGNWESIWAFGVFASICTRILSLNDSMEAECFSVLSDIRTITADWVTLLSTKAQRAGDHAQRISFITKSVHAALVCMITLDVEGEKLDDLLQHSSNTSCLVRMSIVVHDGARTLAAGEPLSDFLKLRTTRLLYRAFSHIARSRDGLDHAIKTIWPSYEAGPAGWVVVPDTHGQWLSTDTRGSVDRQACTIHLDILAGRLLVDGLPLDQPPQGYQKQPLYDTLFGKAVLQVMSATTPGFTFSSQQKFAEYEVQLGMSDKNELIVQASDIHQTIETIPDSTIDRCYPRHFQQDFVYWYNHSKHMIELRPRDDPWTRATCWILTPNGKKGWQLRKDHCVVLGLESKTSTVFTALLGCLADTDFIHLVFDENSKRLDIDLALLSLGFRMLQGTSQLQSRDHVSMHVAADQSIGTLAGLSSKLVLEDADSARLVLIPQAEANLQRHNDSTHIHISKDRIAPYHAYSIDTLFGRLRNSGELRSQLWLAYLHAVSSSCLPDELTCLTGTEAALVILKSQLLLSYEQLTKTDIDILREIACLSPGRQFYPREKQSMQSVDSRSDLSMLAQHNQFERQVQVIITNYQARQIFNPLAQIDYIEPKACDAHLSARDSLRTASFRTSTFGAEEHTDAEDQVYNTRCNDRQARASASAIVAKLYYDEHVARHAVALSREALWSRFVTSNGSAYGTERLPLVGVSYDAQLFATSAMSDIVVPFFLALSRRFVRTRDQSKYTILMYLASLAYAENADFDLLHMLTLVARLSEAELPACPKVSSFNAAKGITFERSKIQGFVTEHFKRLSQCPEATIRRDAGESASDHERRKQTTWVDASRNAVKELVNAIVAVWPRPFSLPSSARDLNRYINLAAVESQVREHFAQLHNNINMRNHLCQLSDQITKLPSRPVIPFKTAVPAVKVKYITSVAAILTQHHLVATTVDADNESGLDTLSRVPQLGTESLDRDDTHLQQPEIDHSSGRTTRAGTLPLHDFPTPISAQGRYDHLLGGMNMAAKSRHEQDYVRDLRTSGILLFDHRPGRRAARFTTQDIKQYLAECSHHLTQIYARLSSNVHLPSFASAMFVMQHGPRLSYATFLAMLTRTIWPTLSEAWKLKLVRFGLAITRTQQARRLLKLSVKGESLEAELSNPGHTNWDPLHTPEILLMEIENDILVREVQSSVANHMLQPKSGMNTTVQLNMGEGKSTTIIPIIAVNVASGSQLARVIVGKPQSKQMAHMLRSKFGGLIDRRLYFAPFSRSLGLDETAIRAIRSMIDECRATGGVLLLRPEHILSFQLMAPENYINGSSELGRLLSEVQDRFDEWSRDIVDECDENFSVKFELIYSMGQQKIVDGGAQRWSFIHAVLKLVRDFVPILAQTMPDDIEVKQNDVNGSFPRTRILTALASQKLMALLATHICYDDLDLLPISKQTARTKKSVYTYLTEAQLDDTTIAAVHRSSLWPDSVRDQILLLRGLLAGGLLTFVFGAKRWRVQYGTACRSPPTRLAVPYSAKDCPSPRSEFSHPDVIILLTTLCYYYQGLCDNDMFDAFQHLVKSDGRDAEYDLWVKDSNELPKEFHQLQGINLEDRTQCLLEVFPALRLSKSTIDYFLSKLVFPKEMREFPSKLTASGWDIAKLKGCLTTGFSGTNDSRHLLPHMIQHADLEETKHTAALVLANLLQPENTVHLMENARQTTDAQHLISTVVSLEPPVQVILDVGAMIIEMTSLAFSKAWLAVHNSKEAVVFVDEDDDLSVVDRLGHVSSFATSPLASRLSTCLIYLDEAHTRGIDLKLPSDYRAAVTLGANLTKDRLVQACMRMRQLGKGQTVIFCIREEIQRKIRDVTTSDAIDVESVLIWATSETWLEYRRHRPLWAVQGERFYKHETTWTASRSWGQTQLDATLSQEFLEPEAQTIEERYTPSTQHQSLIQRLEASPNPDTRRIADSCKDLEVGDFGSTSLQEEQERELAPEQEQETQIQRPPQAKAIKHTLRALVKHFASDGILLRVNGSKFSEAFSPAFQSLRKTSKAAGFNLSELDDDHLWVTRDFADTVELAAGSDADTYQRNVQWILTNCAPGGNMIQDAVIISPYEANELYPLMKRATRTTMHAFRPRCISGHPSLDKLDFWNITARTTPAQPSRKLAVRLALFAGQLFIRSHDDYIQLCSTLGLASDLKAGSSEADGFLRDPASGNRRGPSGLTRSPVPFLSFLMSNIRRNGEDISKTHMGRIFQGRVLSEDEFRAYDEDGDIEMAGE